MDTIEPLHTVTSYGTFQKKLRPPPLPPRTPCAESLTQGLSEYFFKEADKIWNPSDANFKGCDSKNTRVSESFLPAPDVEIFGNVRIPF